MRTDRFIKSRAQLGAKLEGKKCIGCGKKLSRKDTIISVGVFMYHINCYDKKIDQEYIKKQQRIDFAHLAEKGQK